MTEPNRNVAIYELIAMSGPEDLVDLESDGLIAVHESTPTTFSVSWGRFNECSMSGYRLKGWNDAIRKGKAE